MPSSNKPIRSSSCWACRSRRGWNSDESKNVSAASDPSIWTRPGGRWCGRMCWSPHTLRGHPRKRDGRRQVQPATERRAGQRPGQPSRRAWPTSPTRSVNEQHLVSPEPDGQSRRYRLALVAADEAERNLDVLFEANVTLQSARVRASHHGSRSYDLQVEISPGGSRSSPSLRHQNYMARRRACATQRRPSAGQPGHRHIIPTSV